MRLILFILIVAFASWSLKRITKASAPDPGAAQRQAENLEEYDRLTAAREGQAIMFVSTSAAINAYGATYAYPLERGSQVAAPRVDRLKVGGLGAAPFGDGLEFDRPDSEGDRP